MTLQTMKARLKQWRTRIDGSPAKAKQSDPRAALDDRQRIDGLYTKCATTRHGSTS
jgi:hypothetical protein